MKNRGTIIAIIIVLLAIVLVKVFNVFGKKEEERKEPVNASVKSSVTVNAIVMKPELLENKIYVTGTIIPNEEVELRSEISGRITGIYFKEDSPVSKGQLLVKINDSDYQAQLKKVTIQEKLAAQDEYRKKRLLELKGISQEEYDRAQNLVSTLQADAEYLRSQIIKTEIRAPFNGVIGLRYVSEGGYISPNAMIATMQELNPVKVEFTIPEKYAEVVKKGSKIIFTTTGKEKRYEGTVYAVATKIDYNTRSLTVRATAPNPDRSLTPGAFVKIEFTLENIPNALMIPSEALIPAMGGQKVFVVKNDTAKSVGVETGIRTESEIEITQGLKASDTVVITGLLQIRDKSSVRVNIVDKDSLNVSIKTN